MIGRGRIGSEVAKRAEAFGMKVIAYDPYIKSFEYGELKPSLDDLLRESDYISLHAPITDETREMINKKTIANLYSTEMENVRGGTGSFTCYWDWMCNSYMPCGPTNVSECWTDDTYCPMCPRATVGPGCYPPI